MILESLIHSESVYAKLESIILDAVFEGFEHGQCETEWDPVLADKIVTDALEQIKLEFFRKATLDEN